MFNANLFDVIRRPVITEKSVTQNEFRKYAFVVLPDVTKQIVKKAIEKIFEVTVEKVSIMNLKGKVKRFKGRLGKRSDLKKAIVTLNKDQSIDVFGGRS